MLSSAVLYYYLMYIESYLLINYITQQNLAFSGFFSFFFFVKTTKNIYVSKEQVLLFLIYFYLYPDIRDHI